MPKAIVALGESKRLVGQLRFETDGRRQHSQYEGVLLFRVWDVPDSRATKDIDFLAYVENSPKNITAIVRDICSIEAPDDGLKFDPDTVSAKDDKERRRL